MGGGGVKVVIALLGVLAMVALASCQAKDALLEYRVLLVPQGQAEAETTLPVAYPQQPILPPAIGTGAGVIVWEVVPAATNGDAG